MYSLPSSNSPLYGTDYNLFVPLSCMKQVNQSQLRSKREMNQSRNTFSDQQEEVLAW